MSTFSKILEYLSMKPASIAHVQAPDDEHVKSIDLSKLARLYVLIHNIPTSGHEASAWNVECSALIEDLVVSRMSSESLASILAGLISYQKTGVTPGHSHLAFVDAFDKSSGLFQEILHYCLFPRLKTANKNTRIDSSLFGPVDSGARVSIVEEIKRAGYCVLPFKLNATNVGRLNEAAQKMSFYTRERQSEDVPEVLRGLNPSNPPPCGAAYALKEDVESSAVFAELAYDPLIVALASEYLETPVTPINSVLWYSFTSRGASSELAQLFHYDLDTIRWLKVFFYLNDVTEENGPHEYIEGSHRPGAKSAELLRRGYVRISDQDMAQLQVGTSRSIVGPAGTVILGDTRAFHKGKPLNSGFRLLYQPIYAASRISYDQAG